MQRRRRSVRRIPGASLPLTCLLPPSCCPALQMGAVLLGGNATGGVTGADDPSVVAANNTLLPQVVLFEEVPLVTTLTHILAGLSERGPAILGDVWSASLCHCHDALRLCACGFDSRPCPLRAHHLETPPGWPALLP